MPLIGLATSAPRVRVCPVTICRAHYRAERVTVKRGYIARPSLHAALSGATRVRKTSPSKTTVDEREMVSCWSFARIRHEEDSAAGAALLLLLFDGRLGILEGGDEQRPVKGGRLVLARDCVHRVTGVRGHAEERRTQARRSCQSSVHGKVRILSFDHWPSLCFPYIAYKM